MSCLAGLHYFQLELKWLGNYQPFDMGNVDTLEDCIPDVYVEPNSVSDEEGNIISRV